MLAIRIPADGPFRNKLQSGGRIFFSLSLSLAENSGNCDETGFGPQRITRSDIKVTENAGFCGGRWKLT